MLIGLTIYVLKVIHVPHCIIKLKAKGLFYIHAQWLQNENILYVEISQKSNVELLSYPIILHLYCSTPLYIHPNV